MLLHKRHQGLAFAVVVTLITRSRQDLRRLALASQRQAFTIGLVANETKTNSMVWSERVPGVGST